MPITIGSNIFSLKGQRLLAENNDALTRVYERLSSGLRINRASDDAAGLAVSSTLNASARVFAQASRNINDGISMLSITEGALRELSGIVVRISELAEQAANGTLSSQQRLALDSEGQALRDEYNRIIHTTSYNGLSLLTGSNTDVAIQVGDNSNATSQLNVGVGSILQNITGTGAFSTGSSVSNLTSNTIEALAAADINGDGNVDLLVAGTSGAPTYSILLGNGNGTFRAETTVGSFADRAMVLTDANQDGLADLLFYQSNYQYFGYARGLGNGTFASVVTIGGPSVPTIVGAVYLADLNNDGNLDFVATDASGGGSNMYTILSNGNGTFKSTITTAVGNISSVAFGDFDSDGNTDMVFDANAVYTRVFRGLGDGTFSAGITLDGSASQTDLSVADVNNDSILDIVAGGNGSGTVTVRLGNGDGNFKTTATAVTTTIALNDTTIADMNGDGYLDIIGAGAGVAIISLGNGNGTFLAPVSTSSDATLTTSYHGLIIDDFDGDNVNDLVMGASTNKKVTLFLQQTNTSSDLTGFSLRSVTEARNALDDMRTQLATIEQALGHVGADQSRLESSLRQSAQLQRTYLEASSRIQDIDVASEASELLRLSIRQQTSVAILAQVNQLVPSIALMLL